MYMEQAQNSPGGTRRSEDIALDLLKFVASVAQVGRATTASTGFTAPTAPKQDDQITQLLELYTRCLHAVEGKV
jgi:hypothetical protein